MKRFLTVLLLAALLLCAGGAQAQMDDAASTAITADLYATPREGAQVLMTYYPGVRVEVLREANADFVQVNVGRKGGSLTGYMRKEDLVFGEEAVRQNRPLEVCYEQLSWTLYSYCDTRSEVLIECGDTTLYVMGECGDWVHATVDRGSEVITGFVNRKASGLREADRTTGYAAGIRTQPTADEPTREDAVAAARAHILADGIEANCVGGPITAELLDSCTVQLSSSACVIASLVPLACRPSARMCARAAAIASSGDSSPSTGCVRMPAAYAVLRTSSQSASRCTKPVMRPLSAYTAA